MKNIRMHKNHFLKNNKKTDQGFTLIELLVVISIISLLSTIVLASVGSARANGRDAKREVESRSMMNALYIFGGKHNGYVPYDGVADGSPTVATYACGGSSRTVAIESFEAAMLGSGSIPELPIDPTSSNGFCYSYISGPKVGVVNGRDVADTGTFFFISETKRCGEYNRKVGVSVGVENLDDYSPSGYPGELNDILNTGFRICEGGSGSSS